VATTRLRRVASRGLPPASGAYGPIVGHGYRHSYKFYIPVAFSTVINSLVTNTRAVNPDTNYLNRTSLAINLDLALLALYCKLACNSGMDVKLMGMSIVARFYSLFLTQRMH
jgi:hypothetical protein